MCMTQSRQEPRTQRGSSIRSSSISWSGDGCSSSSTCSYLVDYFGLHGYLRWSLILLFMVLKAGLIVAVFMHMAMGAVALAYAILTAAGAWVGLCGYHGVRIRLHAPHQGHMLSRAPT